MPTKKSVSKTDLVTQKLQKQLTKWRDKPRCPACDVIRTKHFMDKRGHTYFRCKYCDGIFVWPIREQDFYLGADTYLKDPKQYMKGINPLGQRWMIEQFERMYETLTGGKAKGSFFEVGAGTGYLTLFALARGWEASGIETSKNAVKAARDLLHADIAHSMLETFETAGKFDAIVMVEVLEHFLNPQIAVDHLRRLSKEGTVVFGTTPNTDSSHWKKSEQDIYQPEDHIMLFNEHSLRRFADRVGLQNLQVEFFGSGDKHDSNLMYAGVIGPKPIE